MIAARGVRVPWQDGGTSRELGGAHVDQADQKPQLGIVLLQTPQGTSFDSEVWGVVGRLKAAGLTADLAGTVFAVEHRDSRALLTPEPAPLTWNDAFGPWIAAHQSPDGLHERYRSHTGLMSVQVGTTGDAAGTRRLLLELVRLIAQHPTASVVTLPGDSKFWYAEQVRNWPAYLEREPALVAPSQPVTQPQPQLVAQPQPVAQRPSGPAVVAHVLLAAVPATMGEALATLGPATASRLAQVPPAPQVPVSVDGRELVRRGEHLTRPGRRARARSWRQSRCGHASSRWSLRTARS